MNRLTTLCLLFYIFSANISSGANLISNGSFELPGFGAGSTDVGRQQYLAPSNSITNWTVSGTGDVYVHKTPDVGNAVESSFNFAQDGNYYMDLSGSGIHATIYQDFATVSLTTYELSFYIGASNWTPPAATVNVQLSGITTLLDTTLTPLAPSTNINWALQTFVFTADSTVTRLSFQDVSNVDDNSSYVDNIKVVVPEPNMSIMACLVIGITFTTFVRKRYRSIGNHFPL